MKKIFFCCWAILASLCIYSQTITPITVTGFNHDVIAETYPNSLSTTDTVMDGSSYVMYSQAFASGGSFAGGLPNNGTVTDGSNTRQFQLSAYNALNALFVMRNTTRFLTLTTPASYQKLSLLALSTEGNSLVNVVVEFTDGTSTTYLTNYTVPDWFNNTTNVVISGFGRVTRTASASAVNGPTTNPRMYYVDVNLNCADKSKLVQRIRLSNVTTAGSNAPFPNAVFLALSGQAYTQAVTTSLVQPTCGLSNGSITVNVTGNTGPYTYSWNTTPVQTGATASNLAPGNYTVTITDASGCTRTNTSTLVVPVSTITITATGTPSSICAGSSSQLNVSATGGTLASYNWTPGNFTTASVSVTPANTTVYTVSGTDGQGCTYSKQVTVTVNPRPVAPVANNVQVCQGGSATLQVPSPAVGTNYNWYTTSSGGTAVGTGNSFVVNSVNAAATYYVEAVTTASGCTSTTRTPVTISLLPAPQVNAGPDQTIIAGDQVQLQGTASAGSYLWTPSTGLSATNILNPVASPSTTTTYSLKATNSQGCFASDDVTVNVVPYCVKPMEAFSPNGDGINDLWLVTNGNCLTSAKVEVFNRYGSRVYRSDNYKNNWDGTYESKPVPDGTYYFVITYQLVNGKKVYLKGNVTILR